MSLLGELNTLLSTILPIETGTFSQAPPARYLVLTPLTEAFQLYADNQPQHETQEVRLSLFDQANYNTIKNQIIHALLSADITITDRRYLGYEADTGYHHFVIEVAKDYPWEV